MINKFFREYGSQRAAWAHEGEIVKETSKKLDVLSKNEEILRNRILRTYLKRNPKTHQLTTYNFDPDTFKQYLMIYDAVLPSIITQNNNGDFVLVFETDNQLAAFEEAFSNGLEIKGTNVYFRKVGYNDLGFALQSVKALRNQREKQRRAKKKDFINRMFPRNTDDSLTFGGLLQPKSACAIEFKEIFHKDWYQKSAQRFAFKPTPTIMDHETEDNKEAMKQYYKHLESLNHDIWSWYFNHLPTEQQMNKISDFIKDYLLVIIQKTLHLPSVHWEPMMVIFGSISYGLFINKFSDIDIGINLRIKESRKSLSNPRAHKGKKVLFLTMLTKKIIRNNCTFAMKGAKVAAAKEEKKASPKKKKKKKKGVKTSFYVNERRKLQRLEAKLSPKRPKPDVIVKEERFEARVPIIKLYVKKLKTTVDISIHNGSNAVSKLIMMYVKYDIRIRPFLCCIKFWCNQRAICEAYKGYLNTFGWVLLGINFLQTGLDIAILPLMKMDTKTGSIMINTHNMKTQQGTNKDTIAELLSSFFEYYANFDFDKYQISILNNNKYEVKDKDAFNVKPHQSVWILQHPLMTRVNVSASVKKWTAHLMKQQLANASDTILQSNWSKVTEKISEKSQTVLADPEYKHSCLKIMNLRYDVNEEQIRKFMSRVARPISVVMSTYKASGRHVGKCYVAFESPSIAHIVMAELNGNLLVGRPVVMAFAPLDSIQDDDDDDVDMKQNEDKDVQMKVKPIAFTRKIRLIGGKGSKVTKKKNKKYEYNAKQPQKQHEEKHDGDNANVNSSMISSGLLLD